MRYIEILNSNLDSHDTAILESIDQLDEGLLDFVKTPVTEFLSSVNGIRNKVNQMGTNPEILKATALKSFNIVKSKCQNINDEDLRNKCTKLLNKNFLISRNYKKTLTLTMIIDSALDTVIDMLSSNPSTGVAEEAAKQAAKTFFEGVLKWAGEFLGVTIALSALSGAGTVVDTANAMRKVVVNINSKLDSLMSNIPDVRYDR